jgi:sensor c-di-GMP phosphodiesterase-like protein
MEQQLRRAIRRGGLTVVYQPVFDLSTSALVGCEALVRWTNEYGQAVRPDRFIALAEEKGFLSEITHLVLKLTVEELGDLLSSSSLRVTVNMAAQDLHDPAFLGYLERLLAEANLPASSVGLELTERSTVDQDNAIAAIAKLQSRGHAVYVDDFGTGYSSLAYLHQLEVHAIKIDRSFTKTIGTEAVTASVIPQILQMARELNLLVVVEGIETPEQVDYFRSATSLRLLGQGFYLSKPMSAAEFRKLVQTGNPKTLYPASEISTT